METTSTLRIGILINGFNSPRTPAIQESFQKAITAANTKTSNAENSPLIDFYDPIVAQEYPEPGKYDLIILSGGTADPAGSDEWVLKLGDYLRRTLKEYPKQKIVGICWGHQTIAVAFGGTIGILERPEVGVTKIHLTSAGKEIFPFAGEGNLQIHEFHRRVIQTPAPGFKALAKGNQVFMNEENTILTFQGHPELNMELAKTMLENAPTYMGVDEKAKAVVAKNMESEHDGVQIWTRILNWIED